MYWKFLLLCLSMATSAASPFPSEAQRSSDLLKHWREGGKLQMLALPDKTQMLVAEEVSHAPYVQGGVILLPGFFHDPATPGIDRSLYQHLPDRGWIIVSLTSPHLTLPVNTLPTTMDWQQIAAALKPRLDAALNLLDQQGVRNIILIGQGAAGMAIPMIYPDNWPTNLHGLILLTPPRLPDDANPLLTALDHMQIPLALVYAHANVPNDPGCPACVQAARRHKLPLREIYRPAIDNEFSDISDALSWSLIDWMFPFAGQTQLKQP